MAIRREIWWNTIPLPDEERSQYFFVVLNDSRETLKIRTRIVESFAPVEDFQEFSGKVDTQPYSLMFFYSRRFFDLNKKTRIYKGKWKKNERLYERFRDGLRALEDYVILKLKE